MAAGEVQDLERTVESCQALNLTDPSAIEKKKRIKGLYIVTEHLQGLNSDFSGGEICLHKFVINQTKLLLHINGFISETMVAIYFVI